MRDSFMKSADASIICQISCTSEIDSHHGMLLVHKFGPCSKHDGQFNMHGGMLKTHLQCMQAVIEILKHMLCYKKTQTYDMVQVIDL